MLTRRGWSFLAFGVALGIAGRLLGVIELYVLATAAVLLPLVATIYVRFTRFDVDTFRELHPPRVHLGGAARVDLAVRNTAPRRSPVLQVRDPFDGGRRWARFMIAPLAPGELARAAYRLPTERRGLFPLGPLQVRIGDPFGLATSAVDAAAPATLTVYPKVDVIPPLPFTRGTDPQGSTDRPSGVGPQGEEFYALREYVAGDDIRRVHWASSAKRDELMIRQDDMPWQGRATVVIDEREGVNDAASLEVTLSAAASILQAGSGRRGQIRMVTTGGVDSGFGSGHAHADALLEHLARTGLGRSVPLAATLATLRREAGGGAVAVVTTAATTDADLRAVSALRARFGLVVLVLLERSAYEPAAARFSAPARAVPPGPTVVRVTSPSSFAKAWSAVVGSPRLVNSR